MRSIQKCVGLWVTSKIFLFFFLLSVAASVSLVGVPICLAIAHLDWKFVQSLQELKVSINYQEKVENAA